MKQKYVAINISAFKTFLIGNNIHDMMSSLKVGYKNVRTI